MGKIVLTYDQLGLRPALANELSSSVKGPLYIIRMNISAYMAYSLSHSFRLVQFLACIYIYIYINIYIIWLYVLYSPPNVVIWQRNLDY
jgi:hypothetical protein